MSAGLYEGLPWAAKIAYTTVAAAAGLVAALVLLLIWEKIGGRLASRQERLPCPICKGVEGCAHSVPERRAAALARLPQNEGK